MKSRAARARLVAGLVAGLAVAATARQVQAQLVLELVPSVGVGATTNAAANTTQGEGEADEYLRLAGIARLRYTRALSKHTLVYQVGEALYRHDAGPAGLAQNLVWTSLFNLTGTLDLTVGANATWSNTTRPTELDPTTNLAIAQIDNEFVSVGAIQQLTYQPNERRRLVEALRFTTVRYIEPADDPTTGMPLPPLPLSSNVGVLLRSEWIRALDTWSVQLDVSDNIVQPPVLGVPENMFLVTALGGWARELSEVWSVSLQAGALGVFDLDGNGVIGPGGTATVSYKRLPWYATLGVSQQLSANPFLGVATINDQALARATLPLDRNETFYLIGYGSVIYARFADSTTSQRAYDLAGGGLALTMRPHRLPLWMSLDGNVNDQHGNQAEGGTIPDNQWASITLTVGGAFVIGHGDPILFHGVF